MEGIIVFTDLDGTLIDHHYRFDGAEQALGRMEALGIPLVICSSKTRAEIERYRQRLSNHHPFISENGGGIYLPRTYFGPEAFEGLGALEAGGDYDLIRLGAPYGALRKALKELQSEGFAVKGFGDMPVEEVASLTGLSLREAELSKRREFDEPFVYHGEKGATSDLVRAIRAKGYSHTEGKLHHILGPSDKGKAVSILINLYARARGCVVTCALGDSPNDIPMLRRVDIPVVVQGPDGTYDSRIDVPGLVHARGIGPEGWNEAMMAILERFYPRNVTPGKL